MSVAASIGPDLIDNHPVSLGTLFAVLSVIVPASWWLSAKFTKIDDRFAAMQNTLDKLPCTEGDCPPSRKRHIL